MENKSQSKFGIGTVFFILLVFWLVWSLFGKAPENQTSPVKDQVVPEMPRIAPKSTINADMVVNLVSPLKIQLFDDPTYEYAIVTQIDAVSITYGNNLAFIVPADKKLGKEVIIPISKISHVIKR